MTTIELQIALNDIFEGEMEWDFPGTLTTLLAVPTCWAVAKAVRRIVQRRKRHPFDRDPENFFQVRSDLFFSKV